MLFAPFKTCSKHTLSQLILLWFASLTSCFEIDFSLSCWNMYQTVKGHYVICQHLLSSIFRTENSLGRRGLKCAHHFVLPTCLPWFLPHNIPTILLDNCLIVYKHKHRMYRWLRFYRFLVVDLIRLRLWVCNFFSIFT